MIRALFLAALLTFPDAAALAQRTDPSQYQARVAQEIKPFLSDCVAAFTLNGSVYSPEGVASCKASQAAFAEEYYDALEGDQNEKFDVGVRFQQGDQSGVKYDATMACAWWIEMVNTGGREPVNIFDNALAQACSNSPGAAAEANALFQEEQRVANLTY